MKKVVAFVALFLFISGSLLVAQNGQAQYANHALDTEEPVVGPQDNPQMNGTYRENAVSEIADSTTTRNRTTLNIQGDDGWNYQGTYSINGSPYYSSDVKLGPSWGRAYYATYIPANTSFDLLKVGARGRSTSNSHDVGGADMYLWNFTTGEWNYRVHIPGDQTTGWWSTTITSYQSDYVRASDGRISMYFYTPTDSEDYHIDYAAVRYEVSALDVVPDYYDLEVNGSSVSPNGDIYLTINQGETIEIELEGENDGSDTVPTGNGGLHISIEEFTGSGYFSNVSMNSATSNDLEGSYGEYYGTTPGGYASYVMAEAYDDDGWTSSENNKLVIDVDPGTHTTLHVHTRVMFCSDVANNTWLFDPASGTPGPIGDPTNELTIHLTIIPPNISVVPDYYDLEVNGSSVSPNGSINITIDQGDTIELELEGENDGSDTVPAGYGGLHFSIEEFDDSSWFDDISMNSSTSDDMEGNYGEYYGNTPGGYANYVMVESYDDTGWISGENNKLIIDVNPNGLLTLTLHTRVMFCNNTTTNSWLFDPATGTSGPIGDPTNVLTINIQYNSTPTRFTGDNFIDKTAKYGIPLLLEAELQYQSWTSLWFDLDDQIVIFEYQDDSGQWQTVPDDGVSTTSTMTGAASNASGVASVYWTLPTSLNEGNRSFRARYTGNTTYAAAANEYAAINCHRPQWLFMVYMCADNDLESNILTDFYEKILDARDNDNVSIVVLFDRIPGHSILYGNWTDTRYYRVTAEGSDLIYNVPYAPFTAPSELNMGDPAILTSFMNTASMYNAQNKAIVFRDHGNGWYRDGICRNVCTDETDNDVLMMPEVYESFSDNGMNWDLIGFDACLMGMAEVAYGLRGYGEYFVASERVTYSSIAFGSDWDYQDFLDVGDLSSTTTAEQLGTMIVNTFDGNTLACWDLSQMDVFSNNLNNLASRLQDLLVLPGYKDLLLTTWDHTTPLDDGNGYPEHRDIGEFCDWFQAAANDPVVTSYCNTVLNQLNNTAFRSAATTTPTSLDGLAIYFPLDASDSWLVLYSLYEFATSPGQEWDDFLIYLTDNEAPTCSISNVEGWHRTSFNVSAFPDDNTDLYMVEFQYSLNGSTWYPLPSTMSASGIDYYGDNGWELDFDITGINDASVWVRARAQDCGGNYSTNWSTTGPFGIDQHANTTITLNTCSHDPNEWDDDTTIAINWNWSDNLSGVDGYSYEWDHSSGTTPDNVLDIPDDTSYTTSSSLANGTWYFHVKGKDIAGNWSAPFHYGPFYIDSTNPTMPVIQTSTHTPNGWEHDDIISLSWSAGDSRSVSNSTEAFTFNNNGNSGSRAIDGYSWVWSQNDDDVPNGVINGSGTSTQSSSLSNGQWYFHIKAIDMAGNPSSVNHYGPLGIDDLDPDVPTITGRQTPIETWCNDNTIIVAYEAMDNGPSGVGLYCYEWTHSPTTDPDDEYTLEEFMTSPALSDGDDWWFHVKARDLAGNWSDATHDGPYYIDSSAPENEEVVINGGDATTNTVIVDLELDAYDDDSGLDVMRISNDGSDWTDWIGFDTDYYDWDVSDPDYGGSSGQGVKTVYVQFKDVAGNTSSIATDSIEFITGPSYLDPPANLQIVHTGSNVILTWSAVDNAMEYCVYRNEVTPDPTATGWTLVSTTEELTVSFFASQDRYFYYVTASYPDLPVSGRSSTE